MEFHFVIENGVLTLSDTQKGLRNRFVASLKDGTFIKEVLTREGNVKTHQQVKAHFGLVVEMIRKRLDDMGVDVCGIAPNKQMIHDILKRACGGVGDLGETIGLREMTSTQASKFFENCRTWAATQLQLDIPNPDPLWREKRTKKEL